MDDMAQEPAPTINYKTSAAASSGCERNVALLYNKFSECDASFEPFIPLVPVATQECAFLVAFVCFEEFCTAYVPELPGKRSRCTRRCMPWRVQIRE